MKAAALLRSFSWFLPVVLVAGCAAGSDDPSDGGGGAIVEDAAPLEAAADGGPEQGEDAPPAQALDAGLLGDVTLQKPDTGSDDESSDAGSALEAAPLDASFDAGATGQDAGGGFDSGPKSEDASGVDLALAATGYTWQSMTSATANTGRLAAAAVNDGSTSTQVDIDSSSGDNANAWEAAGVVFPGECSVTAVTFVQGTTGSESDGDGWFEANFGLELSTDGTTWVAASGWSTSPAYGYSSAVSGRAYAFSGPTLTGVRGVRFVGQVNTVGKSWWAAVSEVIVYGD